MDGTISKWKRRDHLARRRDHDSQVAGRIAGDIGSDRLTEAVLEDRAGSSKGIRPRGASRDRLINHRPQIFDSRTCSELPGPLRSTRGPVTLDDVVDAVLSDLHAGRRLPGWPRP